jgi:aryl-alcohol dehydrogenase-like predicted oxidoreductase
VVRFKKTDDVEVHIDGMGDPGAYPQLVEREVAPLTRELGLTLAQYAVKYVLSFPVASVVVTATAPEELEEYAAASDGRPLPRDHLERLEELWRRHGATLSAAPSSGGR